MNALCHRRGLKAALEAKAEFEELRHVPFGMVREVSGRFEAWFGQDRRAFCATFFQPRAHWSEGELRAFLEAPGCELDLRLRPERVENFLFSLNEALNYERPGSEFDAQAVRTQVLPYLQKYSSLINQEWLVRLRARFDPGFYVCTSALPVYGCYSRYHVCRILCNAGKFENVLNEFWPLQMEASLGDEGVRFFTKNEGFMREYYKWKLSKSKQKL